MAVQLNIPKKLKAKVFISITIEERKQPEETTEMMEQMKLDDETKKQADGESQQEVPEQKNSK